MMELLSCPCGGIPVLVCDDYVRGRIIDNPDYYVECGAGSTERSCGASTPPSKNIETVVRAWRAMVEIYPET